jgi:hypothetical protein
VRFPYAGESTIESRNDVSDAGSEAREDPSYAAPLLLAAGTASCGMKACSAASAAASADFLTAAVTRPRPMFSCGGMSTRVSTWRTHSRHTSP